MRWPRLSFLERQALPVAPRAREAGRVAIPRPGIAASDLPSGLAQPPAPALSASDAFTPTQPKHGRRQLIGRTVELTRTVQALREDKAHVVVYAERGRGKTSFANVAVELLRLSGSIVARHTCEAESSFETIIRGLARDLPAALLAVPVGDPGEGCEAALPPGELRPRDVLALPSRLTCRSLICLIDEFDRIEDAGTPTRIADTIKQLSDRGIPLSFMIVGVSENLEQILGRHPSIQRNLLAIQLPILTDAEVTAAIQAGARQSGFTFPDDIIGRITVLARGNPYMAQLLGLRLTQAAAARGSSTVSAADFDAAVARLVDETSPQDTLVYAGLTANGRDAEMVTALRRIATAEQDPWGRLQTVADGGAMMVGGWLIAEEIWQRIAAADVLRPVAPGSGLYVFKNRFLMHYVLLLACRRLARGEPSADMLHSGASASLGGSERAHDFELSQS